jgi:hypothetical protein
MGDKIENAVGVLLRQKFSLFSMLIHSLHTCECEREAECSSDGLVLS